MERKNIKSIVKKRLEIIICPLKYIKQKKKEFHIKVISEKMPEYKKRIMEFRNKYKGMRCFIICNGPSLNQMDLNFLKNEITFGMNAIYLNYPRMKFYPTFYCIEDVLVAEDRAKEISSLDKMIGFIPLDLAYCIHPRDNFIYVNFIRQYDGFPKFSIDCSEKIYWGGTVTFMCLQLAFYMGFQHVYLIGCDFEYKLPSNIKGTVIISKVDDVNHFCAEYFGKGKRWHHPRLDRMERSFKLAKKVFEEHGRAILNAGVGGKLEVFPRVEYLSLFEKNDKFKKKD